MRKLSVFLVILLFLSSLHNTGIAQQDSSSNFIVVAGKLSLQLIDPNSHAETSLPEDISVTVWASPSWSPDRMQIVYEAEVGETVELHIVNLETFEVFALTQQGISILPRWSPDGQKIAYIGASDEGIRLHLINPDGTQKYFITNIKDLNLIRDLSWSPDSQSLIYTYNGVIYLIDLDENSPSGPINLSENLPLCGEGFTDFQSVSWSRASGDIATIILCSAPKLYLLDVEYTDKFTIQSATLLLDEDWQDFGTLDWSGLDWSPDGQSLALLTNFVSGDYMYGLLMKFDVNLFMEDGERSISLLGISYGAFGYSHPAWQS